MVRRRDFLKLAVGGSLAFGAGKAVDNTVMGYDKNLVSQNLEAVVDEEFGVPDERTTAVEADDAPAEATEDLSAVESGDYAFEFHDFDSFFDRADHAGVETRPRTVDALRGDFGEVPVETVRDFSGSDPRHPHDFLVSLRDVFAERTAYDTPRYVAGAVTDNILRRRLRLRPYLEEDVSYDALISRGQSQERDTPRLFCFEYHYRAAEGLHSVPAYEQDVPVLAATVRDHRHKHVYTGVATVVRDASSETSLRVPMTFVDYKYTTLRHDLRLTRIGDGLNAYNSWHRADAVEWSRRT